MHNQNIILFENRQVRRHYDIEKDTWYFSVVDIVEALTESVNPTDYLKNSEKEILSLVLTWGQIVPR